MNGANVQEGFQGPGCARRNRKPAVVLQDDQRQSLIWSAVTTNVHHRAAPILSVACVSWCVPVHQYSVVPDRTSTQRSDLRTRILDSDQTGATWRLQWPSSPSSTCHSVYTVLVYLLCPHAGFWDTHSELNDRGCRASRASVRGQYVKCVRLLRTSQVYVVVQWRISGDFILVAMERRSEPGAGEGASPRKLRALRQ
ncbi:hypothetical protein BC834DRAFT_331485 [Gloeopeniophorella convolvens]|nr:hypothetical protein BC834DRAFT_331485 [Gloeopeniophorella convolvens]